MFAPTDKFRKQCIAWLLVALYLMGNAGPAHGFVLCMGEGGHLEIEPMHYETQVCIEAGEATPGAGTHCLPEVQGLDHAGDCIDVVLTAGHVDPTRLERKGAAELPSPPVRMIATDALWSPGTSNADRRGPALSFVPHQLPLLSLHTIVLQI